MSKARATRNATYELMDNDDSRKQSLSPTTMLAGDLEPCLSS